MEMGKKVIPVLVRPNFPLVRSGRTVHDGVFMRPVDWINGLYYSRYTQIALKVYRLLCFLTMRAKCTAPATDHHTA